jgi:hypothetical protein
LGGIPAIKTGLREKSALVKTGLQEKSALLRREQAATPFKHLQSGAICDTISTA